MHNAEEQAAAHSMVAEVHEKRVATINGNDYTFLKVKFKKGQRVFAYMSKIQRRLMIGDFSFMNETDFDDIENLIFEHVTFDGLQLSKSPDHFDDHVSDYVKFISLALAVISYPFMQDGISN